MRFTNQDGVSRYRRYRIVPDAGNDFLDDAAAAATGADYLFDELAERIAKEPIKFRVLVQLTNEEDIVDNATVHWPEDRTNVELGTFTLTQPFADSAHEQKTSSSTPFRVWMESSLRTIPCSSCAPPFISSADAAAAPLPSRNPNNSDPTPRNHRVPHYQIHGAPNLSQAGRSYHRNDAAPRTRLRPHPH